MLSKGRGSQAGGTEDVHSVFVYKGVLWWTIQCRLLTLHHCLLSSTTKFLSLKSPFCNKSCSELVTLLYQATQYNVIYPAHRWQTPVKNLLCYSLRPKALMLVTLQQCQLLRWAHEQRRDCSSCSEPCRSEKPQPHTLHSASSFIFCKITSQESNSQSECCCWWHTARWKGEFTVIRIDQIYGLTGQAMHEAGNEM